MCDYPKPVRLTYPRGLEELGIASDESTCEGADAALFLTPNDLIQVDGVTRRVVHVVKKLSIGLPGIEGADPSVRIRHADPNQRREQPKGPPNRLNNPKRWVPDDTDPS